MGQNSGWCVVLVSVCASFVWSGEFGWVEVCSARESDGVVCQMCVGLFWVVTGFVARERDVGQCACEQGVLRGWRSWFCLDGSVVGVWSVRGQGVCSRVLVFVVSSLFVFVVSFVWGGRSS